jgi:hypothetical protein
MKRPIIRPFWADSVSNEQQKRADFLLSRAMHRYAVPFSLFAGKYWQDFFSFMRPAWRMPGPDAIGGELMVAQYEFFQVEALHEVARFKLICITLDGATTKTGKQLLNVIACGP